MHAETNKESDTNQNVSMKIALTGSAQQSKRECIQKRGSMRRVATIIFRFQTDGYAGMVNL